jgi:RNA polymerase sigma factor FliA
MSFITAALSNEEDCLWRKVQESRDIKARNKLVERYLPLAQQIAAYQFSRRPDNDVEFADYLQYASIGLIEAIDRYETTKGAMFKTFAGYRIKGAILNGVKSATERRHQYSSIRQQTKDRIESFANGEKDQLEPDLFTEMLELTVGLALGFILENSSKEQYDEKSCGNDPYRGHAYRQARERLEAAVEKLDERDRRIIQYHYYHHISFESLADLYGVSKGRISQLHKQALLRVRRSLQEDDVLDTVY